MVKPAVTLSGDRLATHLVRIASNRRGSALLIEQAPAAKRSSSSRHRRRAVCSPFPLVWQMPFPRRPRLSLRFLPSLLHDDQRVTGRFSCSIRRSAKLKADTYVGYSVEDMRALYVQQQHGRSARKSAGPGMTGHRDETLVMQEKPDSLSFVVGVPAPFVTEIFHGSRKRTSPASAVRCMTDGSSSHLTSSRTRRAHREACHRYDGGNDHGRVGRTRASPRSAADALEAKKAGFPAKNCQHATPWHSRRKRPSSRIRILNDRGKFSLADMQKKSLKAPDVQALKEYNGKVVSALRALTAIVLSKTLPPALLDEDARQGPPVPVVLGAAGLDRYGRLWPER